MKIHEIFLIRFYDTFKECSDDETKILRIFSALFTKNRFLINRIF